MFLLFNFKNDGKFNIMYAILQHYLNPDNITWHWQVPEPFAITTGKFQADVIASFIYDDE